MKKSLTILLPILSLLAACATTVPPAANPQPVIQTVVVNQTVQVQVTAAPAPGGTEEPASADHPVDLRLGVTLTAQEMQFVSPAIDALQAKHPEWRITLEQTPQTGPNIVDKLSSEIAAGNLPDVQEVPGLFAPPWIQRGAFLKLDDFIKASNYDLSDYYPGTLDEFTWKGEYYGIPFLASPELMYYNKDMFDKAGLPYPTDDWTWDDLRAMAKKLTLDKNGHNADDPAFDPNNIVQWGFNNNPGALGAWAQFFIEPFGGNFCANPECSRLNMTSDANLKALQWWADFIQKDHAALWDPYGGAQTGVPGQDPFISGKAAIGNNNFSSIGTLATSANFKWDIAEPPKGPTGKRSSVLSDNGWVIAVNSKHPQEAWKLIQELSSTQFVQDVWAKNGLSVPSRRSAAQVVLQLTPPPTNLKAILAAMEYGKTFVPDGPGANEIYGKIIGITTAAMKGDRSVKDAYTEAEKDANEILSKAQP